MIGAGGMGAANAYALVKGGQRVAAIADVDLARADAGAADRAKPNARTGEVDADGTRMVEQYAKAARYADFRRMLEREKGLDAVVVAAPDHVHAFAAKAAMELGKHVYVQKPLTYTVHEARVLRDTARRTRVVTQMGNQGHSSRDAQLINQWVRAGALGPVREVHAWTNRPIWPQGVPYPAAPGAAAGPPGAPFGNPVTARSLDEQLAAAMAGAARGARRRGSTGTSTAAPRRSSRTTRSTTRSTGAGGPTSASARSATWARTSSTTPTGRSASPTRRASRPRARRGAATSATRPATRWPCSSTTTSRPAARSRPVRMTWYDGGLMPQRPPVLPDDVVLDRGGGVLIVGDKGVLMHETYGANPRIFPDALFRSVAPAYVEERERRRRDEEARRQQGPNAPGGAGRPRQQEGTPTVTHEMNWVNAIKNKTEAICPFEYAAPLTETMLLGIVALRAGRGARSPTTASAWPSPTWPRAEQYLRREYRAGWTL
jgi:hypothetical protein